jgi:hypothetical protein
MEDPARSSSSAWRAGSPVCRKLKPLPTALAEALVVRV